MALELGSIQAHLCAKGGKQAIRWYEEAFGVVTMQPDDMLWGARCGRIRDPFNASLGKRA